MDKVFKRKKEEEEKARLEEAYEEFREEFEEGVVKVSKTFIRGDVVNPDKKVPKSADGVKVLYKPSPVIQINKPSATTKQPVALEMAKKLAAETAKKIMKESSHGSGGGTEKHSPLLGVMKMMTKTEHPQQQTSSSPYVHSKSSKSGSGATTTKKAAEKSSRLTNLEAFKEELKQIQAVRDERKGLRQQLKDKLGVPEEEINRIAPVLDTPYSGPGVPANVDFENDTSTTNLYVCNLPSDTKPEDFFETFGTFGPLASAKILYPKPDEDRHWPTLSGFVAFMSRKDAERAMCAMHGDVLRGGCELRVSWARPVIIPPLPFYVPPPLRELAMPDPPSGLPFNAKPLSEELRLFLQKYHDLPKLGAALDDSGNSNPAMVEDYKKMVENATVRVVVPTERPLLQLIHRVVEFLIRCGPLFEAILMARERKNPMYRFLFDNHHPTHVYYRWRLYSILQGDDQQRWRLDKFKMFAGGSWWQPPPHALFELGMPPQLYGTAYVPKRKRDQPRRPIGPVYEKKKPSKRGGSDHDDRSGEEGDEHDDEDGGGGEEGDKRREERRKRAFKEDLEREERQKRLRGVLHKRDRAELEELLRNLTPEKLAIGDAMIWCLDHAECSKEIAQCIAESLCIKETPLHKKIARIYLVSDILANCAVRVKDAFYFRQHFGTCLQKIFIQLNETLESIESRLKAEQFRQRIMLCFRNWEDHALYPTTELIQWQNIFLGLLKTSAEPDVDLDGEPMPPEEEEYYDEDVDGVPIPEEGGGEGGGDEDIDGIPMDMERGAEGQEQQMEEEDEFDGVPMDQEEAVQQKQEEEEDNRFTTGSWSTIEPEETAVVAADAAAALPPTKSKWESIGLNSRWDQSGNVSSTFALDQQQLFGEDEEEPARKRHKLPRLSPERGEGEETRGRGGTGGGGATTKQQYQQQKKQPTNVVAGDNSANTSLEGIVVDEEERRKMLREIEVKVMKLQDELESDGSIPQAEVDKELATYRKKLMARAVEKLTSRQKEKEAAKSSGDKKRKRQSPPSSSDNDNKKGDGEEQQHRSRSGTTASKKESSSRNRSKDRADRDRDRSERGGGGGGDRDHHRDRSRDRRDRSRERDRSRDRDRRGGERSSREERKRDRSPRSSRSPPSTESGGRRRR